MKVDVIEEITRIYGYDNFELKSTQSYLWPIRHQQDRENEYEIKKVLAEKFGMTEVHSYIWYDKKMNKKLGIEADSEIKLINSLASDNDTIRTNMAPALLCFVNKNIDFYEDVNMFEFGHVVKGLNDSGLCDERKILSGILTSKTGSEKELLSKAKQIIDFISYIHKGKMIKYKDGSKLTYNWVHPNNSSLLFVDDVEIGYITLVNPAISAKLGKKVNAVLFEIDYNVFSSLSEEATLYREPSKYPGIEIDFSLLVNKEDKFEVISDIIEDNGYEYLLGYSPIDIFHDEKMAEDKKSITIRLKFGSDDRTLLSEDITGYTDRLLKIFEERGITLRT
jgi:phenylalanyl-tRNA synthetase beta chain